MLFCIKKMKTLLIGSSSDIAKNLKNSYSNEFDFVELTSTVENSEQHQYVLMDESTYPNIDGNISGFVYFPGSINLRPFSGLKLSDFQTDYEINVLGLIKVLKHYHKQFTDDASVVFFSSVAASVGMPYHSSIATYKSAIEGLCRSLAAEWSPKIRVNCIAPSVVKTKLSKRLFRTDAQHDQLNNRHPLNRVGQPNDIADVVSFLLSKKSSWITGQVISVDGGLSTIKK